MERAFMGVCPRVGVMPPSFFSGEAGLASPPRVSAVTLWVCPACVLKPSEKSWFSPRLHSCPQRMLRVCSATLNAGTSLRTAGTLSLLGTGHKFSHFFRFYSPQRFQHFGCQGARAARFAAARARESQNFWGILRTPYFFASDISRFVGRY